MLLHYFERLPWWRRLLEWLRPGYTGPMPIEDAGQTWYTIKEAAKLLGMTKQGVHDYIARYDLETRRVGKNIAISFASISWIKQHNKK